MNGLRLGLSADVLPYTSAEVLAADERLNRFILGTAALAGKGLIVGGCLSLFFLRKTPVIFYGLGFGVGTSVFRELIK